MYNIEKTLSKLNLVLKQNSIDYVIIGGIAVLLHGKLRTTQDIDVSLLTKLENLDSLYEIISKSYLPLFEDSKTFFKQYFILPVKDRETNFKIDFAAGLSEFDKKAIDRKVTKKVGDITIDVCTVEDLILYKLFSARPQDLIDVEDLILVNKKNLDTIYLKKMAGSFSEVDRYDVLDNLKKYLI